MSKGELLLFPLVPLISTYTSSAPFPSTIWPSSHHVHCATEPSRVLTRATVPARHGDTAQSRCVATRRSPALSMDRGFSPARFTVSRQTSCPRVDPARSQQSSTAAWEDRWRLSPLLPSFLPLPQGGRPCLAKSVCQSCNNAKPKRGSSPSQAAQSVNWTGQASAPPRPSTGSLLPPATAARGKSRPAVGGTFLKPSSCFVRSFRTAHRQTEWEGGAPAVPALLAAWQGKM